MPLWVDVRVVARGAAPPPKALVLSGLSCPGSSGTDVRFRPERVSGFARIQCPFSAGTRNRAQARKYHTGLGLAFVEVHVATPLKVCLGRDEKRIYERGRRGEIRDVAGLDFEYEVSERPDLVVRPDVEPIEGMVGAVLDAVRVASRVDLWKDLRNWGVKEAL